MVTKQAFLSMVVVAVAGFSLSAKADLPDSRSELLTNVINPVQKQLDATVERNEQLEAWNADHKDTLKKLNEIVAVMNKKWDEKNPGANKVRADEMRKMLQDIWSLEDQKAIGTVTDLKAFIEELRDSKIPGSNSFQFDGRTRQTYFDDLVKKIDKILEDSKIDPLTQMRREMASVEFRMDANKIPFPTITKEKAGFQATPEKKLDIARVDSLNAVLSSARNLDKVLQACPSPKLIEEKLAQIVIKEKASEAEHKAITTENGKAIKEFADSVSDFEKTRVKAESKAQTDREKNERALVKKAIADAFDFEVVPVAGSTVVIDKDEVSSEDAKSQLLDSVVTDVMSDTFKKDGHSKLMETLKKLGVAPVSKDDPAAIEDFSGLTKSADLASKIIKGIKKTDDQATIQLTKLDLKKSEALPGAVTKKLAEAKSTYDTAMSFAAIRFDADKGTAQKHLNEVTARLSERQDTATTLDLKLATDRTSLTSCQTGLPKITARVHALGSDSTPDVIDGVTHDVESLTGKSKVK